MTIELWHYNIKLRHNNLDSQHSKDFNPAELDEICNNAIEIWGEQQYSGNNHKQVGFEVTQQRIDNLSTLVVKYPVQPALTPDKIDGNIFEFNLNKLKFPYKHMVRVQGKIKGCSDKITVEIVQHDDLDSYLHDPFKKPSKKPFPRLLGTYGKSSDLNSTSLFVYSDGTFDIQEIYPEYIKIPNIVSIGGYNDIEGNIKPKVESDIPECYHSQIIDIAVDEIRRILGDQRFELNHQKQSINE